MRIAPLSLTIALLLGSLAHAEGPLPLEVAHPEKLAADNPVQTVGGIISIAWARRLLLPCRSTCPPCRKNKSCCCK